jgi:hypothetical protein
MSNIMDSFDPEDLEINANSELRASSAETALPDPTPIEQVVPATKPAFKVKPRISGGGVSAVKQTVKFGEHEYTAEEVIAVSRQLEQEIREKAGDSAYNPDAATQVIGKSQVTIKEIDYTKLTMDDIYNLDIPIIAKAFGAEDALKVDLLDKNYEPRWVNKTPRRLGQMLSYGFIYVTDKDLAKKLEVEVVPDAQGHFTLDDVVLMRIPKIKYYSALRAAHERAIKTVSSVGSARAAKSQAVEFMQKNTSGQFANEVSEGKIDFYKPGIEI